MRASRLTPWRSSCVARTSPPTRAPPVAISARPSKRIGRPRPAPTWRVASMDSWHVPNGWGRPRARSSSVSCAISAIPGKLSAKPWASCASPRILIPSDSSKPLCSRSNSGSTATARCTTSSSVQIRVPTRRPARGSERIRTYAAPITSNNHRRRRPMLIEPLLQLLKKLKLYGILSALERQLSDPDIGALRFEERLGLLLQHELAERDNYRLSQRLRVATLPQPACLEDLDP